MWTSVRCHDEPVQVPQNLINGIEFKGIDFWIDYKSVVALAKATEDRPKVCFAKQSEIHIRSELGAANRGDRTSG